VTNVLDTILRSTGAYKFYENRLNSEVARGPIPDHIGIILDGNRRWAQNKSYTVELGHAYGADVVEKLLDWCHELKIRSITLYVLSTENFSRTSDELRDIVRLIEERLQKLLKDERIYKYRVRVKGIGKFELLPESLLKILLEVEEKTAGYDGHFLNIAIAYGGRAEITDVVRSIAEDVKKGTLQPSSISEETISARLYTSYLPNPEPDLIIRTSGEERMSGFLLWQGAYSELIFMDVYWPSFRKIDLLRAIRIYQKRQRRMGK
jgi:tritrans,polycis-undecaprenyl-diphosphate synthase [geranylgeranyl-diphosphate specific]